LSLLRAVVKCNGVTNDQLILGFSIIWLCSGHGLATDFSQTWKSRTKSADNYKRFQHPEYGCDCELLYEYSNLYYTYYSITISIGITSSSFIKTKIVQVLQSQSVSQCNNLYQIINLASLNQSQHSLYGIDV